MNFQKLLEQSKEETNSNICVGLDLAASGSRKDSTLDEGVDKTEFALNLIEKLSPSCCCFKINRQFILDVTREQIKLITAGAHEHGRPVIVDHKISDIGSTNDQAIFQFKQEGFDAFTASPFPGNIQEIGEMGHVHGVASIILALMSNPEAVWMKETMYSGLPLYQYYSRQANEFADGVVVGATGHVTEDELKTISEELSSKVVLSPGIGAQGGDVEKLLEFFRNDVIFNVSRGVVYQQDPLGALHKYNDMVSRSRTRLGL
ncbi:MAG: orotidine 5'-phosphate decarboxylase [Candidatus Odinarchaeota archaeon]